jgi:AcrR family transcriptional regulator
MATTPRQRSTLTKDEARQRYVEVGELAVLEQVRRDAQLLDDWALAVGPFTRLDANAVAAADGKTRGAITNLFGSQAAFQTETMAHVLSSADWIERVEYPEPSDFATAEEWLDALLAGQSARGPVHGAEPAVDYGSLWALWLSAVPYGLWSEEVSRASVEELLMTLERLEEALTAALEHFALELSEGTTVGDLAAAIASLTEGAWLSQCLTLHHPADQSQPASELLRRSGRLLWRGATVPR